LFLLPTIVVLGTFNFYPAFYSLYMSFFDWRGFTPERTFVGLGNYIQLFNSGEFWNSLRVTVIYASGVTLVALVIGLAVAVLLNQQILGRAFYRTLYFLPVITPTVAAGVVWKYLFDPTNGVVNQVLSTLGIPGPGWLSDPSWSLIAVIIVGIWKRVGFNMVIYLAALQSIPRMYYEAAAIDGANAWHTFRRIIVPLLIPTTLFLIITSLIDAFQIFDLVYIMTAGGPLRSTDVIGYYLYRYGFRYHELGFASAIAYVMFILIFVVTILQFRITRGGGVSEG
jgi:multiple sugar transport system permease protein